MDISIMWGIIGGVVAAVIGAWVGYKLQGRGPSDKEIFHNWQIAFSRPAFRGKFDWMTDGTDILSFKDNIRDLMRTMSTGASGHQNPTFRGGGISQIKNKKYFTAAWEIYMKLENILKIVTDPAGKYKDETAREIDKERDEIISQLNEIWGKLKIAQLKLPSTT